MIAQSAKINYSDVYHHVHIAVDPHVYQEQVWMRQEGDKSFSLYTLIGNTANLKQSSPPTLHIRIQSGSGTNMLAHNRLRCHDVNCREVER